MGLFSYYDEREFRILRFLKKYNISSINESINICNNAGLDVFSIVKKIQPICFDDVVYAFIIGASVAINQKCNDENDIAGYLGEALQSFSIPGSISDKRQIGIGHGNLCKMLFDENIKCFAFVAGHESFAAAEGAINIVRQVNDVRKNKLRIILNGLGKDAAQIISRINGFTYVQTKFDYNNLKLTEVSRKKYSDGVESEVLCYGANDVMEGVFIMEKEDVDISIIGNSTNPARFQHPVVGIYKKNCNKRGKKYFSIASGGGTGRTLHPDNVAAGPSSYGFTDTLGKMHCDLQFAGSSSVPAHVEMMGFVGIGNNPLIGAFISMVVNIKKLIK